MRRSLGRIPNPATIIGSASSKHTSSSAFSTSSAGRGGGGRGGGSSDFPKFQFVAGKTESNDFKDKEPLIPSGVGHGRGGKPLPPSTTTGSSSSNHPILPSFPSSSAPFDSAAGDMTSSANTNTNTSSAGRGQGAIPPQSEYSSSGPPRKPIFFLREESASDSSAPHLPEPPTPIVRSSPKLETSNLPSGILSVLSGAGRGKPLEPSAVEKVKEQNRHLRAPQQSRVGRGVDAASRERPRLSAEEATKNALGILSRGDADAGAGHQLDDSGRGRGGSKGGRGTRGGRGGRGVRGNWRGRGGRGEGRGRYQDSEDDYGMGLYLGDDADGEKLAKRLGPENMNKLVEGFEEMSGTVLPSPMDDAYIDALHTNYMIECEPEYMMEEFGSNPEIDEKPPIPLRDALEKMKPFLMAYEGIQSHEEWEEVVKVTMEKVPIMKEIVDYYSGPDRVTAKEQQEELERVAKTLPERAPTSVKRFTERAVISLQSNPGWGFDKKCQFMDKLVWEVSQHYN